MKIGPAFLHININLKIYCHSHENKKENKETIKVNKGNNKVNI